MKVEEVMQNNQIYGCQRDIINKFTFSNSLQTDHQQTPRLPNGPLPFNGFNIISLKVFIT